MSVVVINLMMISMRPLLLAGLVHLRVCERHMHVVLQSEQFLLLVSLAKRFSISGRITSRTSLV